MGMDGGMKVGQPVDGVVGKSAEVIGRDTSLLKAVTTVIFPTIALGIAVIGAATDHSQPAVQTPSAQEVNEAKQLEARNQMMTKDWNEFFKKNNMQTYKP